MNLLPKLIKKLRLPAIKNSYIHKSSKIEAGSEISNSKFGKYSFCGYNCNINNTIVGNYVSIANKVSIGGEAHPIDWVSTSPVFYFGKDSIKTKFSDFFRAPSLKTIIGSDVWIGESVLVKQGVTIGNGSIIGMGSIVTKDVEPYSIVAGNPAKLIRFRFDKTIIVRLMSSQWWTLDDRIVKKISKHIQNPELFLNEIENL